MRGKSGFGRGSTVHCESKRGGERHDSRRLEGSSTRRVSCRARAFGEREEGSGQKKLAYGKIVAGYGFWSLGAGTG